VTPVEGLLQDRDVSVRRWAAFALGEIEDSTAAVPLAALLVGRTEHDAQARALAVEGLGKLQARGDACEVALADRDPSVLAAALLAAWRIPGVRALEPALRLSRERDPAVRWPAAYCLMRLSGAGASGKTPIPTAAVLTGEERSRVGARLRELALDRDVRVRLQAARGLGSFPDTAATGALCTLASDRDWRVRVEAIRGLAWGKERPIDPAIPDRMRSDPNPNVRIAAVEALATLGDTGFALPRLWELLDDPLPRVREVAFGSLLARMEDAGVPAGSPAEVELASQSRHWLREPEWNLRALAADGASLLPPDSALAILRPMLRDEPRVAKAAVGPYLQILAAQDDGRSLTRRLGPAVDTLVVAADPVLRAITIESITGILDDSTKSPAEEDWARWDSLLQRAFTGARGIPAGGEPPVDSEVRLAVIEAAALHPERPAARRLLAQASSDPEYLVRRAAAEALRRAGAVEAAHHAGAAEPLPSAATARVRDPEPVETGLSAADYASILEWARRDHWAAIETEDGVIAVRLFAREAPLTCWNFARLARSGFFDHGRWHRVVPDFVLQDGCPRGDGYGGSPDAIRCEINRERFLAGTLGMALSGKDTGSSQFFLTHSDQPHLDGRYTVFGRIETGGAIADAVVQGDPIRSIRVVERRP
jgi:cyclophilin family peptidyl-prolyl cis-trans isomerase/HEAT repeat protein